MKTPTLIDRILGRIRETRDVERAIESANTAIDDLTSFIRQTNERRRHNMGPPHNIERRRTLQCQNQ